MPNHFLIFIKHIKEKLMKKILLITILIFAVLGGVCGYYDFLTDANLYRVLGGISLALVGAVTFIYLILAKKRCLLGKIIYIVTAISIALGYIFLTANYLLGAIFMFVASALIITKKLIRKRGLKPIAFISIAIALPTTLTLVFANFYGFDSVLCQIANIIYMVAVSVVLAQSIYTFYKKKNLETSPTLAFGIVFYVLNFLIVLNRFSNLSRYFGYTITALFVLSALLFALANVLRKCKCSGSCEKEERAAKDKCSNKGIIKFAVSVLIAMTFVVYSFVGIMGVYKVGGAKITKEQFMSLYASELQIPIIEINTENNQLPKTKEEYLNCSFSITNCDDADDNFSVSMKGSYDDADGVGIRLRGNSTKLLKKQPFRIKFDKKKSLLGLKKNKSWVLLADHLDISYVKNYTAFSLASELDNLDFTPTPNHVALIINNQFKGLYLLCEQIDEKDGRVDVEADFDASVDNDFPFLVEMDRNAHLEGKTGVDNFYVDDFYPVEIKYPESDERGKTKTQDRVYDYINEYVNAVFETLKTGEKKDVSFSSERVGFEDLVDVDSLIDYYLVNEIMNNPDNAWGSIYLHKSVGGKLKFGPVWDFDWSMSETFDGGYDNSEIESAKNLRLIKTSPIYSKVFKTEENYQKLQARFNEIKQEIVNVSNHLGEYKAKIQKVANLDSKMWHGESGGLNYDYVRLYLLDRKDYMESVFSLDYNDFIALMNI